MKKITLAALILLVLLILVIFPQERKESSSPLFEQPLLITSAGQNAEILMASVLAKRAGLDSKLSKIATPKDLVNIKTIVLVLGASSKGLGAAGLDMTKEKERVNLLIEEAQKKTVPLLCLHLGGEARRGPLSDELISAFLPFAKMAIVVKSGNKDGFLSGICEKHDIALVEVEKTADVLTPLKDAFK
ncbi:MAG: hypothetical protein GTN73_01525 [Candidatus Aminicenantes bacterium]|nr:hypothetical protein [Candidatus Aminicenantes bacterium]